MLLNLRFVPMGIAIAPSLRVGPLGRALRGQALVDASWALANRGGGRFDIDFLLGSTLAQYPAWVGGTVVGALAGGSSATRARWAWMRSSRRSSSGCSSPSCAGRGRARWRRSAAVIALVLTPLTPAGVPDHRGRGRSVRRRGVQPMTVVWITVAGLCVTTAAIKAFGPVVFGGRDLPGLLARAIPLLAPALLAALVVTETVGGTGRSLVIDARVGGLVGGSLRDLAPLAAGRRRAVRRGRHGAAARYRVALAARYWVARPPADRGAPLLPRLAGAATPRPSAPARISADEVGKRQACP